MAKDWLAIVEAAYRTDLAERTWLEEVLETARPILDEGAGVAALLYDASSMASLVPVRFVSRGGPDGIDSGECIRLIEAGAPDPRFLAATFGALSCGLVSETFGVQFPAVLDHVQAFGVADMLAVNGIDPGLHGCFLTGNLPRRRRVAPRTRGMWTRVATHLAAGYRLRRRLGGGMAADRRRALQPRAGASEAVLQPSGKIEHAVGVAVEREAREALRRAVRALERSRGPLRRKDPQVALDAWKGLVEARWTLIDHFDSDGRRYVVAASNETQSRSLRALSPRERQVVAYAALGHQNKLIAYELGLSPSTVGVLLGRAARKLGARSRVELARVYRQG
jgi:DNA-binding CsgD family transcriptional regulator